MRTLIGCLQSRYVYHRGRTILQGGDTGQALHIRHSLLLVR